MPWPFEVPTRCAPDPMGSTYHREAWFKLYVFSWAMVSVSGAGEDCVFVLLTTVAADAIRPVALSACVCCSASGTGMEGCNSSGA